MTIIINNAVNHQSTAGTLRLIPETRGDALDVGSVPFDEFAANQALAKAGIAKQAADLVPFVHTPQVNADVWVDTELSWNPFQQSFSGRVPDGVDSSRVIQDLRFPDNGVAFGLKDPETQEVVAWLEQPGRNFIAHDTAEDG